MTKAVRYVPIFAILIGVHQSVLADIYKCRAPNGKTIYSEAPCEGMPAEKMEVLDNSLDSSRLRREAQAFTSNRAPDIQTRHVPDGRFFMSDYDKKKRIEENLVTAKSASAFPERKNDALYENGVLKKRQVKALSYNDDKQRANLKVDLGSLDYRKRQQAAAKLISLYQKY